MTVGDGQLIQNATVQYQLDFLSCLYRLKMTQKIGRKLRTMRWPTRWQISFSSWTALVAQEKLSNEQMESSTWSDYGYSRTDGALIVGSIGKQKALYDQQITSYKRDAEHKATKLFTDTWITQKTLDVLKFARWIYQ
jgi:hypothetical protein